MLTRYKQPIDVHLMHPTTWRDVDFRRMYRRSKDGSARQRVDWNIHNDRIVRELLRTLKIVSGAKRDWAEPFRYLHASADRLVGHLGCHGVLLRHRQAHRHVLGQIHPGRRLAAHADIDL
jgi:hypothetical protein